MSWCFLRSNFISFDRKVTPYNLLFHSPFFTNAIIESPLDLLVASSGQHYKNF